MAPDDKARGPLGLQAANWSQLRFRPGVVGLDPIVRVHARVMHDVAQHIGDDHGVYIPRDM